MTSPPISSATHRDDIDGLRAIAVLAVIAFHVWPGLLPGGFIGVDVFFVISGYLISRNILVDLSSGRFSLTEFYRRRVKRIAPAMLLVTGSTLLAAYCLMLPLDAQAVAKSAFWSILSAANVHFWLDLNRDYFAASSAEVPLLHLWSLGVEEQFYLLWPLLLLMLYKPARSGVLLIGVVVLALLSFTAAQWLVPVAGPFAYYMLPTRAGELMLGAIAALLSLRGSSAQLVPWCAEVVSIVGITVLIGSLAVINERMPFPGWITVAPTLATALLIFAGESAGKSRVNAALSNAVFVWVGSISYSAYLWHWPLLAFYRYGFGAPTLSAGVIVIALTLVLAQLSYTWVEQPARRSRSGALSVWIRQYLLPGALVAGAALLVVFGERHGLDLYGATFRHDLDARRQDVRPVNAIPGVCQRQRLDANLLRDNECVSGSGTNDGEIMVWGDSNSTHFVPMLRELAGPDGWRLRHAAIGACPPLLSDPQPFVTGDRLADCRYSLQQAWPEVRRHRVLLIAASWTTYQTRSTRFVEELKATLRQLSDEGHTVVVFGKVPVVKDYDPRCRQKALRVPLLRCPEAGNSVPADVLEFNRALSEFARSTAGVRYFDVTELLCPSDHCSAIDAKGRVLYNDSHHLSIVGSTELGRQLRERGSVPAAFRGLTVLAETQGSVESVGTEDE